VKASAELGGAAGHRDDGSRFIARNHRSEKPLTVHVAGSSNERVSSWYRFRAGVNDANAVKVIHLKAMNERAVGKRGVGAGNLCAIAPDERAPAGLQGRPAVRS
jgi:hypothetical protein